MDLMLRDKAALVTGASSGIGRAIAKQLAREGARVAFSGRRREALESLAGEISAEGLAKPVVIVHDALAEDYVDALAAQSAGGLGEVQILVNNAGGSRAFGSSTSHSPAGSLSSASTPAGWTRTACASGRSVRTTTPSSASWAPRTPWGLAPRSTVTTLPRPGA